MTNITNDKKIAFVFALLTVVFITMSLTSKSFFNWIFERHQNQMSWYIRPIFLIPFCFFAYKKSWSGISFTIFCLFTSMFWFNKPDVVSEEVNKFLQFEKDWLYGTWNYNKILLFLSVPCSFTALGLAFWKRNLWTGLGVIVLMATGKIIWSIQNAGESGKSILIPAIIGLLICSFIIVYGWKLIEKKSNR